MQAAEAVRRAVADGKELVSVEFNLPLIGATDLDDWPGGVRQQYQAIAPMVGELLKMPSGRTRRRTSGSAWGRGR